MTPIEKTLIDARRSISALEVIIDDLQKERDEALRRVDALEKENEDLRWELLVLQEEDAV